MQTTLPEQVEDEIRFTSILYTTHPTSCKLYRYHPGQLRNASLQDPRALVPARNRSTAKRAMIGAQAMTPGARLFPEPHPVDVRSEARALEGEGAGILVRGKSCSLHHSPVKTLAARRICRLRSRPL